MSRYNPEDGKVYYTPTERLGEGAGALLAALVAIVFGALSFELGAETLGYDGFLKDDYVVSPDERFATGMLSFVSGMVAFTAGWGAVVVGKRAATGKD